MPLHPIEKTISYLFVQVTKAHRDRIAQCLTELNLYVGQEMILMQLWRRDGLTQSDLVKACKVEPPTLTKVLGRMKKGGLIVTKQDPTDARVRRVYLVDKSRSLRGPVQRCWLEGEEQLLAGFTIEEHSVLRNLLTRMLSNLQRAS